MKQALLLISFLTPFFLSAQKNITINDQTVGFDCIKVLTVDQIDTLNFQKIKIYHAQINANCLELGILYGDCATNIEFVTDNKLVETQNLTLCFSLRYTEGSTPCKSHDKKATLYFDMLPYKNMRMDKPIMVMFAGERFRLMYK